MIWRYEVMNEYLQSSSVVAIRHCDQWSLLEPVFCPMLVFVGGDCVLVWGSEQWPGMIKYRFTFYLHNVARCENYLVNESEVLVISSINSRSLVLLQTASSQSNPGVVLMGKLVCCLTEMLWRRYRFSSTVSLCKHAERLALTLWSKLLEVKDLVFICSAVISTKSLLIPVCS